MASGFLDTYLTPEVRAAQEHYYGRAQPSSPSIAKDPLTPEEAEFIARRDSFYLGTVSGDGWPYIQHRGGPPGFLKVLAPDRLAFADFRGNRQLLTTGNLAVNDRVVLFLMDYPRQERLKIVGHARVIDAREQPELAAQLAGASAPGPVERIFLIEVNSFDWNCPKHITPRYTIEEIDDVVGALKKRIADLENQLGKRP